MSKAPAYVFAVATLDNCGACKALKGRGELDKYAAMCRELGDIEFHHVNFSQGDSEIARRHPQFMGRVIGRFPTIMFIEMRGQRWTPNLDARALGSVYVLNGKWQGPDNEIGPNPNGAAIVSREASQVRRWVESILVAQQRGGPQVPIMVRSSSSVPTPAPAGAASASNSRSAIYRPIPQERTLSTFTGNQMVRQFHNRY